LDFGTGDFTVSGSWGMRLERLTRREKDQPKQVALDDPDRKAISGDAEATKWQGSQELRVAQTAP
jgi:hypothetical protein